MTTFTKRLISMLTIFVMLMTAFVSWTQDEVQAATKKVKLNETSITVYVGKSKNLKMLNTSKKVKWSSSKKKVAVVNNNGKVTGKKVGETIVTAKIGEKKYKCKVVVKIPKLNYKKLTLKAGETKSLKLYGSKIKSIAVDDKNIVSVSKNGKITAKKKGKTAVTVKGTNKKTYKCVVTVEPKIANEEQAVVYCKNLLNIKEGDNGMFNVRIGGWGKEDVFYRVRVYNSMEDHSSTLALYGVSEDGDVCDLISEEWVFYHGEMVRRP